MKKFRDFFAASPFLLIFVVAVSFSCTKQSFVTALSEEGEDPIVGQLRGSKDEVEITFERMMQNYVDLDSAYLGCYADTSTRALPVYMGKDKSAKQCASLCSDYKYFGRQWEGECWCGDGDYAKYGGANHCKCNNKNVGEWKQCVYRTNYLGCFVDEGNDRALPTRKGSGTVDDCAYECSGYKYFGRQWTGECWCGNGAFDKHGKTSGCDCEGSNVGAWKQCVYRSLDKPPANYLGCFKDTDDRALPVKMGDGKSVEQCASLCLDYKYFGRQWTGQCWCGNGDYAKYGKGEGCDCEGTNVGAWKQCVYRPNYLGCFVDTPDRALPVKMGSDKSVDECAYACSDYKYYGRQWTGECWCGNGDHDKYGEATGCDCEGSNVGAWKQCIYLNPDAQKAPITPPYLGCFADDAYNRALPYYKGKKKSVEQCAMLCSDFKFFGRQAKGECRCGDGNYDKHGPGKKCKCEKKNVGKKGQCVYRANYLGCFTDVGSDRALPVKMGSHKSVDDCSYACSGYKYYGRQWTGECWCGNGAFDKHGEAGGCDCEGSNVGAWKQCVYEN